MADPVFDEDDIIHLLRAPVVPGAIDALQRGSMQALLDLYDRKVDRKEFIAAGSLCVTMYAMLSRVYVLKSIEQLFRDGELAQGSFDKANEEIAQLVRVQAEALIEVVKRLQMCPTSKDKVH